MSQALTLAILGIQVLTGVVIAIIGYYSQKYIKRIDRNTRFRRWIAGDNEFADVGEIDRLQSSHEEFRDDLDAVKSSLRHVNEKLDAIIDELDIEQDIDDPDSDFRITDD